ncbi:MAG: hypothetical protein KC519_22670, partial [Anaerolineae bacterium]|nr:hypothetical protein [Anaerolineae bacterium]
MPSRILFTLTIVFSLGVVALLPVAAQGDAALECDIQGLLEHQQEHAARLDDLAARLEVDRENALEDLYITGIAYQSLAIQCGFLGLDEATTAHEGEHQDTEAVTHDEDGHNDADHETALDRALAVGDPVRGEQLFNTLQPAVGFACATCHRVDTTERLIGPGLLGVGSPTHDPS